MKPVSPEFVEALQQSTVTIALPPMTLDEARDLVASLQNRGQDAPYVDMEYGDLDGYFGWRDLQAIALMMMVRENEKDAAG